MNIVGELWPLVHLRSLEGVFGPKTDEWLVHTVAGLLAANDRPQWRAAATNAGISDARR